MLSEFHPTDVEVGSRMRKRRIELGLSQTSVANELKVSFQQIQKYEKGRNRIAASRLVMLSRLLDVSPEFSSLSRKNEMRWKRPGR